MRQLTYRKRKSLSSGISMIWRASSNHHDDWYIYVVPNVYGLYKKNRKSIQCPSLPFVIQPAHHDKHIPVSIVMGLLEQDDYESPTGSPSSNEYKISDEEFDSSCTEPQCFSQAELSDLERHLNLS